MRNLLIIHLESLNHINYRTNRQFFPVLRKWERRSLSFSRFFSTATSTLMVVSDLAYGGLLQNEPCDTMISGLDRYCYESSLLDDLQRAGYRVKAVDYPRTPESDVGKANERHFVGHEVRMESMQSYEGYLQAIGEAMDGPGPFAVLACNYIGNIGYYGYMGDTGASDGFGYWESSCVLRDQYVGDLMGLLEEKGLLAETTVLFYGDHGDDICAHGRHKGLLHVFEPYAPLIHTPFFVYDSRIEAGETDDLMDITDIRTMVERLLKAPETGERSLCLEDLGLPAREYAFSRSSYAAQKVRERSFHKGYGLTDGTWLFMAGDQGMELYHIGMDEGCQHNLLDYFDYSQGELTLNRGAYEGMRFHIRAVIDEGALKQIEQVFYVFRERLLQEAEKLYRYAGCPYLDLEVESGKIHYGWEEKERRAKVEALKRQGTIHGPEGREEFDLYDRYLKGRRIIVYGAGDYGKYFCEEMTGCTEIIAWADRDYERLSGYCGMEIQPPEVIKNLEYDAVFIAIANKLIRQEVKEMLLQWGVPEEKIY